MRRTGPPSEIGRLTTPLLRLLDGAWQRMHWWIGTMAVLYALSGITVVHADEVAIVLRWGRLVGATPALQQHGPGLLFALPRPIDEVVRVPVKHVSEVAVSTLAKPEEDYSQTEQDSNTGAGPATSLSPLEGYALTGDQNIVQVSLIAHYRIRDPAEWAFYGADPESLLGVEVSAAMVRSLGEMGVDRVLADGRKDLMAQAMARAQQGLDRLHSGVEISSLEATSLAPPEALAPDFDAVQSAFITAETKTKDAQAFAAAAIPGAHAEADVALQSARGSAEAALAQARGDAAAFLALDREYRTNPVVVGERLYRDAVEAGISNAGTVRWIPPPAGAKYQGLRIEVQQGGAGTAAPTPRPIAAPAAAPPKAPPAGPPAASGEDEEGEQ